MRQEAAAKLRSGVDAVISIVETHGQAETVALVAPLPLIARRSTTYRGQTLTEMDLDAILQRRPALVLVDELAHTNTPGSRHPKRWQDIDELLAAGIDVMTTVNIQHVESLNDVVGSFTHVRVRETVPDAVFENAQIELIDLPPEDLISRLGEGKIYVPEQARYALDHFFSKGNLRALRELALRHAAQYVDARITGRDTGTAGDRRILVAVSKAADTAQMLRDELRYLLAVQTIVLHRAGDTVAITAHGQTRPQLSPIDQAAAEWAMAHGEDAGLGTGTLDIQRLAVPPAHDIAGHIGGRGVPRAALLASLSHDLRTPLTASTSTAEALSAKGEDADLVETVRTEARRLNRFLSDLPNLTRIEEVAVTPDLVPTDLTDVIAAATGGLHRTLAGRILRTSIDPNLPLVRAYAVLLNLALLNLVDNAAKYSPYDAPIENLARMGRRGPVVDVLDGGPGSPQGSEQRIFDRFARG
ncbi:His Kinase A (phospho-acceptor) domain-containing protein [Loktanella fryxellensis]|uniref:histidine kinase n=1 Tax=Loktanella fryxellensis TaxID=245187 RepID=A0A1H8JA74_9RHOB|nr:histidine kinase dimerization/phospho-acceptor domain-containing protein [Loktanella fryxellensis]SEN77579.1 His Kinase A (phospho-acceptor) domain-containing protein [Loktanella fryxellensis]